MIEPVIVEEVGKQPHFPDLNCVVAREFKLAVKLDYAHVFGI